MYLTNECMNASILGLIQSSDPLSGVHHFSENHSFALVAARNTFTTRYR